jgi:hypothetical protein
VLQEAHKMVADANIKRIQAEKRLAESDMKVSPYLQPGVVDPWHFGTDPDPAFFVSGWQDANRKLVQSFFCLLLFEGRYIYISFHG